MRLSLIDHHFELARREWLDGIQHRRASAVQGGMDGTAVMVWSYGDFNWEPLAICSSQVERWE